uniref:Tonsoku-like protein n=1 Tax=Caenorhabditis japonica TaxID=281687 RepID=A0A8R1DZA2_CAEJA
MMKKEKNAINLIKRGKFTDAVDQYNEIAHDFQKNGDLEEAIQFCEKGSSLAREHHQFFEGSLCERRLSELHALLGNREPCLQHLVSFRRMALKCASRSQEQLSFHVEAWCLQQLYQNGAGELRDIERAVQAVEMSRKLVDQYKTAFRDGEPGATPKHRKAELFILEAQLQEQLGNNSKALQLLDKAEHFLSANDKSIRYELRRTQCSVAPIARRIDIAELMEDEAPEDKKAIALNDLAHLYVVFNRLSYGYTKLATVYITHGKNLIANDLDEVTKRLCILYRLVKYTNILQNPRLEPKISLCELHEATGDLFDKYYQTMLEKEKREYRHFVRDNILKHFGKMLEHKRSDDDVRRAYNAMALIYVDLEEHSKALDYFEKHLEVLNRLGVAENQIIDTRLSILSCQCKLHYSDVQKSFSALKEKVALPNHKKELFDIWSDYCSDQLQEQEAKKWREMAEQIPDVVVKNEDDETDVLFGKLSDEEVLERIVDENELLRLDNMTEYQLKKTNDKGETILHHAAQQPDNEAVVEKLCRQGCNVNARDNGGWTPLSEAVAHEELDNARVLLRYGADVNSRSVESFVSSEESQTSSSSQNHHTSLTPLMEACANGFVRMARLLIENKAKIELKDSAGWTAYDHFRRHLAENGCTEEQKQFDEFLKNEMKKCNLAIKIPLVSSLKSSRIELDDSPTPDDEDDLIIMDSLASRKRRFSPDPTDKTAPKRQPKNRENARLPAVQKRPHFTPPTAHSNRNLRLSCSLLSSRKSTSPTTTIRSAPSVIDGADEVQCLGIQRKRKSLSPKRPSPRSVAKPRPPASSSSTPSISARETLDVLPVKCVFELSAGLDKIHPVMLPLARLAVI